MNDKQFWSMIEDAWYELDDSASSRKKLALGKLDDHAAMALAEQSVNEVIPWLQESLEELPKEELLQFDQILERKLYDIDRSDIHEHTDGSDDGFLYARGFIVAAGQGYYDAVSQNPSLAMMDLECENMCYLSARIYEEKFGDLPDSGISRETGSNTAGWSKSQH